MKKLSMALMIVLLIGTVASGSQSAFADPGVTINLSKTTIHPGETVIASKVDVTLFPNTEPNIHAHLTLLVINKTNTYAVPADSSVCNAQSSDATKDVWRLVAVTTNPINPELNAGGTQDIHVTFPTQTPAAVATSSLGNLVLTNTGTPFTPTPSSSGGGT